MLGIQSVQIHCSCIHSVAGVISGKPVCVVSFEDCLIKRFLAEIIVNGADGHFQHILLLSVNGFLEDLAAGRNTIGGEILTELCNLGANGIGI